MKNNDYISELKKRLSDMSAKDIFEGMYHLSVSRDLFDTHQILKANRKKVIKQISEFKVILANELKSTNHRKSFAIRKDEIIPIYRKMPNKSISYVNGIFFKFCVLKLQETKGANFLLPLRATGDEDEIILKALLKKTPHEYVKLVCFEDSTLNKTSYLLLARRILKIFHDECFERNPVLDWHPVWITMTALNVWSFRYQSRNATTRREDYVLDYQLCHLFSDFYEILCEESRIQYNGYLNGAADNKELVESIFSICEGLRIQLKQLKPKRFRFYFANHELKLKQVPSKQKIQKLILQELKIHKFKTDNKNISISDI